MLREFESAIKKENPIFYIDETKKKRKAIKTHKKGKGKERSGKIKVAKKYSKKDKGQCFHYDQDGHCKRNCKDYLIDKAKHKLGEASGIFMISLHLLDFYDNTWVLDTKSVYHICNSLEVLARSRRLARGEIDLKKGNEARIAELLLGRSRIVSHPPERYMGHISRKNSPYIDPQAYEEAIMSIDSGKWQEVMNSDMDFMYSNKVWNLVDVSQGIVPIGCKWIFKKKIRVDEKVETYKTRLVAKEYRQRQGVDYVETFSPIAMLKSIKILLAIAEH
ncbi:hypothetical protein OPV22_032521 [Ensete ventricosum]|uniref:Reverse transcriptase Ty1/copia-type domain-containing protein n=1 Tax=Ensete ventricosum TaxID=4639 RepID=A0AAV8P1C2_ENSVE|nr:hypothetical protein OPV22_032521 [Ensete ventricosum]